MGWPEDYDESACFEPFDGICPGCGEGMFEFENGHWVCEECDDYVINDALKPADYDKPVEIEQPRKPIVFTNDDEL